MNCWYSLEALRRCCATGQSALRACLPDSSQHPTTLPLLLLPLPNLKVIGSNFALTCFNIMLFQWHRDLYFNNLHHSQRIECASELISYLGESIKCTTRSLNRKGNQSPLCFVTFVGSVNVHQTSWKVKNTTHFKIIQKVAVHESV